MIQMIIVVLIILNVLDKVKSILPALVTCTGQYGVRNCCRDLCKGQYNADIPCDMTIDIEDYIGISEFQNCQGLVSVTIKNAEYIYNSAFQGCFNLQSVSIINGVKIIDTNSFRFCTALTTVTFSSSLTLLTEIRSEAFSTCPSLTSINIPNTVISLGPSAFYDCRGLTSISIPNSIRTINDYTFEGCISLEAIELPDNLFSIGIKAFKDTALTRIIIPASVFEIKRAAFENVLTISCLYSWNPTLSRLISMNGLPTDSVTGEYITACPCDYGSHLVDYVCTPNEPSATPTTAPTNAPDNTGNIVGIAIGCFCFITFVTTLTLRLLKRRKYKQFKVHVITDDSLKKETTNDVSHKIDIGNGTDTGKFDSQVQYFKLGDVTDYQVQSFNQIVYHFYKYYF